MSGAELTQHADLQAWLFDFICREATALQVSGVDES
jgi:hypothetical protein